MSRVPVGIYGCMSGDKPFDHYEMRTILSFSIIEQRGAKGEREKTEGGHWSKAVGSSCLRV